MNASSPFRDKRGMTLLEVFFASTILLFVIAGVMGTLVQSRRITEANVSRNSTLVIIQGYLVQLKTMDLGKLIGAGGNIDSKGNPIMSTASSYTVETVRGGDPANPGTVLRDIVTVVPLSASAGYPPDITTFIPGESTSDVVDNLRNFDMQKDLTATAEGAVDSSSSAVTGTVLWKTIWPKANNYPPYTGNTLVTDKAGVNDLKMNLWIWVKDLTNASVSAQQVYGITIIYTYQVQDGAKVRYLMGSVRAVRSFVRTI